MTTTPLSVHTTPDDRAKLRWVMRCKGEEGYAALFVHSHGPDMISFTCSDGERLHRWYTQAKVIRDAPVPLLGGAFLLPDLAKYEAVDLVSLPAADVPVLNFERAVGVGEAAVSAIRVASAHAFREAVMQAAGQGTNKDVQRSVVLDLHAGTLVCPGMGESNFAVAEKDGDEARAILNAFYLKQAAPEAKKSWLIVKVSSRTCLLRSTDQVAVLALQIEAPGK